MEKRITVLVGISNSGKSTWAKSQWDKNPEQVVIINRDKIRECLFGYCENGISHYYDHKDFLLLETKVTRYEETLIAEALADNKHVIVDKTHLNISFLRKYKYWNVPTDLKIFNIELEEALLRNRRRLLRRVPSEIIKKQHKKFLKLKKKLNDKPIDFSTTTIEQLSLLPSCIIFDIDETLAHIKDRDIYDLSKVHTDILDLYVGKLYNYLDKPDTNYRLIICTGRSETAKYVTHKWLSSLNLKYHSLHMRKENDKRADYVVKEEMWREIAKQYFIVGIFDDRLQVVRRARALGLKVFNVEYNNF